jgi:hypothetical protein
MGFILGLTNFLYSSNVGRPIGQLACNWANHGNYITMIDINLYLHGIGFRPTPKGDPPTKKL